MKHVRWMMAGLALVAIAVPASAQITEIVPWSTINGTGTSTSHFGFAVEGQTSYHQLTLNDSPRITKVEDLAGAQTQSELLSTMDWVLASGSTSMTSFYGFGISGDYLQFGDTSSDSIWRVDKVTGALTQYVALADIAAHIGDTDARLLSPHVVANDGEHIFYESNSDSILKTAGAGGVTTLISSADLTAATGNDRVSGGLGMAADGTLYWGSNSSDDMWKRAPDGTLSQVLTTADITALTGETAVSWKDIFAAPNGMIYFQESRSDSVLRFDPADPVGTLEEFVSGLALETSVIGTNNIVELGWYDGQIAANAFGEQGLYSIPEPASLALLALGGLALIRRR